MRRFFIDDITGDSREVLIRGPEFVHLKKVLRLGEGARVSVFNGRGLELKGKVIEVGSAEARVEIEGRVESGSESPLKIVLFQGFLKGDRPEFIVQKATELGVREVVFYTTGRTVPDISGDRVKRRLARWSRIAVEAAKQCGRAWVPDIAFGDFPGVLALYPGATRIALYEGEGTQGLKEALKDKRGKDVAVLIGPEGGFSVEELSEAVSAGFIPVGLGPRILRSETATLAVLSIIQYELGDLQG